MNAHHPLARTALSDPRRGTRGQRPGRRPTCQPCPLSTYFAPSSVNVKPNILFVLDDSGSMSWDAHARPGDVVR